MYKPMDDDTSIASRCPRPPHGTFRSFPSRAVVVVTRARARTNATRERTNERIRIFFSRRYRHDDAHRYASRARLDRECARAHSSACIRAGMRLGFGDARERDAGDAETREGARGIFGIFLGRVRSRGRRAVVARSSTFARARTTTGRRPNVDRTSTGRHVTGVGLRG